jgi:hypothetical protein
MTPTLSSACLRDTLKICLVISNRDEFMNSLKCPRSFYVTCRVSGDNFSDCARKPMKNSIFILIVINKILIKDFIMEISDQYVHIFLNYVTTEFQTFHKSQPFILEKFSSTSYAFINSSFDKLYLLTSSIMDHLKSQCTVQLPLCYRTIDVTCKAILISDRKWNNRCLLFAPESV